MTTSKVCLAIRWSTVMLVFGASNFRLEVDVVANDNDGMGLVWGYQDIDKHYRFQLMNDRWPEVPSLDGFNGPYMISHKRISNEEPWSK